jgi:low affinity Fe/Cu permease
VEEDPVHVVRDAAEERVAGIEVRAEEAVEAVVDRHQREQHDGGEEQAAHEEADQGSIVR